MKTEEFDNLLRKFDLKLDTLNQTICNYIKDKNGNDVAFIKKEQVHKKDINLIIFLKDIRPFGFSCANFREMFNKIDEYYSPYFIAERMKILMEII